LHSKQVSLLLSVIFTGLDQPTSLLHNLSISILYRSVLFYCTDPGGGYFITDVIYLCKICIKSAAGGQEVRIGGPWAEDGEVQLQPEANHRQRLQKSGCQFYKTFFFFVTDILIGTISNSVGHASFSGLVSCNTLAYWAYL
jgi:hypothetical protein